MDHSVLSAMARWPNVPAVYGYLGLNRRGDFLLQGRVVTHPRTREFIHRNYALDDQGRAFFQNGPQRAYADLEATPWIYRLMDDGHIRTHTDQPAQELREARLTPDGDVLLVTELGPGLVHDQDLDRLAEHLHPCEPDEPDTAADRLQSDASGQQILKLPHGHAPLVMLDTRNIANRFRFDPFPEPAPKAAAAVSEHRPAWRPSNGE